MRVRHRSWTLGAMILASVCFVGCEKPADKQAPPPQTPPTPAPPPQQPPFQEENRPPIIVDEGSLYFRGSIDWVQKGSKKKWKPDHSIGKHVKSFDVTGKATTTCSLKGGTRAVIDYRDKSSYTFEIDVEDDGSGKSKKEPVVKSPVDLDYDGTNKKVLVFKENGHIRNVELFDSANASLGSCAFNAAAKPVLGFTFNH